MRHITYLTYFSLGCITITTTMVVSSARAQTEVDTASASSGGGGGGKKDWLTYNYDASGSRSNDAENKLKPSNVDELHVLWTVPAPGPVYATPTVKGNRVYVGDTRGNLYALSKDDGQIVWQAQTDGGGSITASALVHGDRVIVGDLRGVLYGFDRADGHRLWSIEPDTHAGAAIYSSAVAVGDNFAVGIASTEEGLVRNPDYVCCSSRGSVLVARAKTGTIVWRTPLITDAELAAGSSGATVWSTPTYDGGSNTLYVTTGNNFSEPATGYSDAIIALNSKTGAIRWVNQRTADDIWNFRFPASDEHPDFDFGDSPQIYRLPGGRKVVAAGQKSGFFHVLDAGNGAVVNFAQYAPGAALGGVFADSANARGINYVNCNEWPNGGAPTNAYLVAVSGDGAAELWRHTVAGSANLSGVAVANGVVYFVSSFNGNLYALDAEDGTELISVSIGASVSGPSVVDGRVYVGTGAFSFAPPPGATGSIVALGR